MKRMTMIMMMDMTGLVTRIMMMMTMRVKRSIKQACP